MLVRLIRMCVYVHIAFVRTISSSANHKILLAKIAIYIFFLLGPEFVLVFLKKWKSIASARLESAMIYFKCIFYR